MECSICFSDKNYNFCVVCNALICYDCINDIVMTHKNRCHICNSIVFNHNKVEDIKDEYETINCNYRDIYGFFFKEEIKKVDIIIGSLIISDIFSMIKINDGFLYLNDTNFPFYYFNNIKILNQEKGKVVYNKFDYHKQHNITPYMIKLKNKLFLIQKNYIELLKNSWFITRNSIRKYNYPIIENKYSNRC